jgi:DNA-binding transcriptional LysR family regulator
VQKQLDTLNRHFQRLVGELLVVKQGRGKDILFTPTGRAVTALAERLFTDWTAGVQDCRRRLGRTLTVGTTECGFLCFTASWMSRVEVGQVLVERSTVEQCHGTVMEALELRRPLLVGSGPPAPG